ncbi:DUF2339 domain-containing protein [Mycolicibacter sp. MYC123]|uniref:DUF2339 domain-containing protein n=1 Tax=[Mycobacterium] zoologicum TaxID=2872311 RepID=A0ABU5YH84_9MYCO|nr:DUF2339 domain-containing protein [Mycolicibacter sp. MYC123]MEB3048789.1 DUF2339 domain-containing protein [Mycolicibacter sp. MYC123]
MTEPRAVLNRLTTECQAMSWQLYRVSTELAELDRILHDRPAPAAPPPPIPRPTVTEPKPKPKPTPKPKPKPTPKPTPKPAPAEGDSGWVGKLLAVAGVAVTLVGVVLLLVLAAQAGILRPQIRVAGGFALSAALVAAGHRLHGRPGGRTGAIALAATGIAAAYLDIIAITAYYHWIPAAAGLAVAAAVGGAGLALARRWNSEHLGLLVLVPLIVLAPIVTADLDLLLIGFLLALSAAALPVQLGKDWIGMFAARIAAATLPLLAVLASRGGEDQGLLIGAACAVAALLAVVSGLLVLPASSRPGALAVLSAAGTLPLLAARAVVGPVPATALAVMLSVAMLAIVLVHRTLPPVVTRVFQALSAVAALIAVTTVLHGSVLAPVLLAMGVMIAVAGQHSVVARWAAVGFGFVGLWVYLGYATPGRLIAATAMTPGDTVSTLAASVALIALVAVTARAYATAGAVDPGNVPMLAAIGGSLIGYAVTAMTVTTGVALAGTGAGFLAGHMAATLCWIAMAAALLRYALRLADREARRWAVTAGLALVGAATAKLFLFDLATLDGMFRVAAFIVAGLLLLGMGTGYARSLAQQDGGAQR